ncbi:N-formylglutamate amidohydrolase [Olivibacter sp. CPCC 100613]|uniref:N-formylglutamate amidohydrolase n=1 Tax=Olivibacter sp. CPCC 100613 TaxID=3079931 RepID=UPI002FF99998
MKFQIHIERVKSPIVATAIHDGHYIPPVLRSKMFLAENERMHEEDPYTAEMINLPVNRILVDYSRFIVDLNRPRDRAIYHSPDEAWGLRVWATEITTKQEKEMLAYYDNFYSAVKKLLQELIKNYGYFIVLDIHTYNHRRQDPHKKAPLGKNPEINIGTINNLPKWRPIINTFIDVLSKTMIQDHLPDVRENVKFKGGAFSNWICSTFGEYGGVLSIEFKKTFMDEWTGRVDIDYLMDIRAALRKSIPLLENELTKLQSVK